MNEPVITNPNYKTEIRLTDSLAAPLIEKRAAAHQEPETTKSRLNSRTTSL